MTLEMRPSARRTIGGHDPRGQRVDPFPNDEPLWAAQTPRCRRYAVGMVGELLEGAGEDVTAFDCMKTTAAV